MCKSETVETNIKRNQLFELTKFTMVYLFIYQFLKIFKNNLFFSKIKLPCVFFNLSFASNEKIKIEFPYKMAEYKKESVRLYFFFNLNYLKNGNLNK